MCETVLETDLILPITQDQTEDRRRQETIGCRVFNALHKVLAKIGETVPNVKLACNMCKEDFFLEVKLYVVISITFKFPAKI